MTQVCHPIFTGLSYVADLELVARVREVLLLLVLLRVPQVMSVVLVADDNRL